MSTAPTKLHKPKMAKIAMSLPPSLVDDLNYLSDRLGVSRSALAAELLGDAVTEMRRVVSLIPPNPTPADLLRMRGESEAFIRQRIASASQLTDDLFAGPYNGGGSK
jgi:hypothetical protein